jgi:hypothetical protein
MSVREVARYGRWAVLCNGDPMATFARFIVVDGPVDLTKRARLTRPADRSKSGPRLRAGPLTVPH